MPSQDPVAQFLKSTGRNVRDLCNNPKRFKNKQFWKMTLCAAGILTQLGEAQEADEFDYAALELYIASIRQLLEELNS